MLFRSAMNEQKDVFMAVYGDGVEFLGFFALGEPVVTTNRNTTTDGNTTTKTSSWSQTTPVISQFTMNVSYKDGIETRTETINASFKPGDTSASGTYDHDKKVSYEGDGHDSGMVTVTTPTLAGRSGTAVSYHPYTLVTYLVDEADNPIWEKNEDGSDRTDENGNKIQATESQTVWCYWLGEDFRFTAAQSPYLKVDGANYFEINETLNDEEEIIGGTVILTAKTSYTEQDVYVTEQNEAGQEVKVQLYDEEYIRAKNADGSLATEAKVISVLDDNDDPLMEYEFVDDSKTEYKDKEGKPIQREVIVKQEIARVEVNKLDDNQEPVYEDIKDEEGNVTGQKPVMTTLETTYYRLATDAEIAAMTDVEKEAATKYLKCESVTGENGEVLYYKTATKPVTVTQNVAKYDLIRTAVKEAVATRDTLAVTIRDRNGSYNVCEGVTFDNLGTMTETVKAEGETEPYTYSVTADGTVTYRHGDISVTCSETGGTGTVALKGEGTELRLEKITSNVAKDVNGKYYVNSGEKWVEATLEAAENGSTAVTYGNISDNQKKIWLGIRNNSYDLYGADPSGEWKLLFNVSEDGTVAKKFTSPETIKSIVLEGVKDDDGGYIHDNTVGYGIGHIESQGNDQDLWVWYGNGAFSTSNILDETDETASNFKSARNLYTNKIGRAHV